MNGNPRDRCPNCSAELDGPYCASCGQRQLDLDRPFREITSEAMDAFLSFDARILRTLWPLIARPGFLTIEFLEGRRARYVHPFKLYFVFSLVLFLALALSGYSVVVISDTGDTVVAVGVGGESAGEAPEVEAGSSTAAPDQPAVSADVARFDGEESTIGRLLSSLGKLAVSDPKRLNRIFTDRLAKSIIILVPVFALLLRALYWRRNYISQLVFSLHLHSFAFLALFLGLVLDLALGSAEGPGNAIAVLAIAVYTFIGLRRVQRQGRLATAGKMLLLLVGYIVALMVTMMITLALTALSI